MNTVKNYITGLKESKTFLAKIEKLIPVDVELWEFKVKRTGYGHYRYTLLMNICNLHYEINVDSSDSPAYDEFMSLEGNQLSNCLKRNILSMIEDNIDNIMVFIFESDHKIQAQRLESESEFKIDYSCDTYTTLVNYRSDEVTITPEGVEYECCGITYNYDNINDLIDEL